MGGFEVKAMLHSLQGAKDSVYIVWQLNNNNIVVKYKDDYYTAIYNPFVGCYYVDDIYGRLSESRLKELGIKR